MEAAKVTELVDEITGPAGTIHDVRRSFAAITQLESWLASRRIALSRQLSTLASSDRSLSVEHEIARATHSTLSDASKMVDRATAVQSFPTFENALASGSLTSAHVEVLRSITSRLTTDQATELALSDGAFATAASHLPPDKFRDYMQREIAKVIQSSDETTRFERQKAAAYLRHWINPTTGMWNLRGEFDPLTGARLEGKIRNKLEAMFHGPDRPPPHLEDAGAQQDHLRSRAFVSLVNESRASEGRSARPPRAEIVIVVDHQTLKSGKHARTKLSVNNGAELPIETIREIALHADVYVAEVDRHGLPLNLGRVARTAGKFQRIALRTVYDRCAVLDCNVRFDNCQPHHIDHFEHGGATDLGNLIPLCSRHHHRVHDDGWHIDIDDRRRCTVTLPNNTRMCSPPKIPWAS